MISVSRIWLMDTKNLIIAKQMGQLNKVPQQILESIIKSLSLEWVSHATINNLNSNHSQGCFENDGQQFPDGSVAKNLPVNAGDAGLILGLGRSSGGENVNPFQHSCLGYPMDRGAWYAAVHVVTKSQTQLSD